MHRDAGLVFLGSDLIAINRLPNFRSCLVPVSLDTIEIHRHSWSIFFEMDQLDEW
jgi:hypothetical protein